MWEGRHIHTGTVIRVTCLFFLGFTNTVFTTILRYRSRTLSRPWVFTSSTSHRTCRPTSPTAPISVNWNRNVICGLHN